MTQRATRLATVIVLMLAVTASVLLTSGATAKKIRLRPPT